jgi:hypothetical protein
MNPTPSNDLPENAQAYGKRIGQNFVKKFDAKEQSYNLNARGLQTGKAATAIAEMLYQCYKKEQETNCGELLNKWIAEHLWAIILLDYMPKLQKIWQYLYDNKYNKSHTLPYGDADGNIWVEYPKQISKWTDNRKILIHTSHCTMADDNTHIFMMDKDSALNTLEIRTVWPRQNLKGGYKVEKSEEYPNGWFSWGDDRDVKIPSLQTYRDRNFEYGYHDATDKGYVVTLQTIGEPKAKRADIYQQEIQHAVWLINIMENVIEDKVNTKP